MSLTEGGANLWNSEVKGDMWSQCDVLWRPRPEFCLAIPLPGKQSRKVLVRDSWIRFHTKRPWMEETCQSRRPFISSPARDEDKIVKCYKSGSLVSKKLVSDLTVKGEIYDSETAKSINKGCSARAELSEREQPLEEPWLPQSSLLPHCVEHTTSASSGLIDEDKIVKSDFFGSDSLNQSALESHTNSKCEDTVDPQRTFSERYQLVEEPWLFQSSFPIPESDAMVDSDVTKNTVSADDEAVQSEIHDLARQATENMLPGEESDVNSQEDSVSTLILINSSICTMQRIAVLEDEKLVELLLEPVKNNVLCDSVYLGVVTKLVPHMGGAFVNIGSPRPSLMDIKKNREPFIFSSFGYHTKEKEVNGVVSGMLKEHVGADENERNSHDGEVVDVIEGDESEDDSVQYMHDEFHEDEIEDDLEVTEVLNQNVNGSLVGSDEVEADIDNRFSQLDRTKDMKDCTNESKWVQVQKGTKIVVQVAKEGLGTKGPTLTAYPKLRSRFWVLSSRSNSIGISKKISGVERTRLRVIAKTLQPPGFGLTVRTVAAGHSLDELHKDLEGLLLIWKDIMEHAKSAALAADEGVEGAVPVILHRAMGQTLSVVQDYFSEKVKSMVVDSPRTYHEVTNYLQEIAPDLCDRVELYHKRTPLFDDYNIEEEINNMLSKRVPLANGGYLVIEQTEALVSIDVNGGQLMLGEGTSQERAILDVNLAAAKQIARELRLRDIGGIIVVDFIDMVDDSNKRLVYEEVKKAVERDRSMVKVSELSRHGLMEITRKRVRPSVTFMISEPCNCCHATGRVEALETSFSKIEHEICRLHAMRNQKADPENPKSWPRFILRADRYMCNYLTSGKKTRLAVLSSSLKVWILLKVARGFSRGAFEVKPVTDDKDRSKQHKVAISMLRPTEVGSYYPKGKLTLFPVKKWKTGGK